MGSVLNYVELRAENYRRMAAESDRWGGTILHECYARFAEELERIAEIIRSPPKG